MKIEIEIECTPDEARQFFGLPAMGPVQEAMQDRMAETVRAMNPEEVMKTWMPGGMEAMGRMQQAFFEQMARYAGGTGHEGGSGGGKKSGGTS